MRPEILRWVKIVVLRTVREKRLSHLDVDELISCGLYGYTQCLERFDPKRGVKFKTYAEYRIKGAVLDEVRKMIGDERCKNKRPRQSYDYDLSLIDDEGYYNVDSVIDLEMKLRSLNLSEKEIEILKCRIEGNNLFEIGQTFGFSESRASQILVEIKKVLAPWLISYTDSSARLIRKRCSACGKTRLCYEFEECECKGSGDEN